MRAIVVGFLALALLALLASFLFGNQGLAAVFIASLLGLLGVCARIVWRRRGQPRIRATGSDSPWQTCSAGGVGFQQLYVPGSGRHARQNHLLFLRMPLTNPLDIEIAPETSLDRYCKSLGIACEFQTGDADFDAACYIRGDIDSLIGAALKKPATRDAVRLLFGDGCTRIRLRDHWLQANWSGFDPDSRASPGDAVIAAMATIRAAVPVVSARNGAVVRQGVVRTLLWSLSLGFACCFYLGLDYPVVRSRELWGMLIPLALVLWLLFAFIAAWLLRGHSRSHDRWLLLACVSIITCTLGSHGLLRHANGASDPSSPTLRVATVIDTWKGGRKFRFFRHVAVADWGEVKHTLWFPVASAQIMNGVKIGRTQVTTHTRTGRLGIEWYEGYSLGPWPAQQTPSASQQK